MDLQAINPLPQDFLAARRILLIAACQKARGEAVDIPAMPAFPGLYKPGKEVERRIELHAAAEKKARHNAQKRAYDARVRPHGKIGRPRKEQP